MCGFIGLTGNNRNKINVAEFKRILSHRGPDNTATMELGNMAFIHNRLSIIDLEKEANQPMVDYATGNVIVFNGEIYNFRELKETYKEIAWMTKSDTEVILKLYAHLGKEFVNELNGIFAFAIYDKKQNKILLYRDRFGVKPLYFAQGDGGFIFASEAKAILKFRPREINLQAIYDYLEFGKIAHNNETFFEEIYALEAAHFLECDLATRKINKFRYWDVSFDEFPSSGEKEVSEKTLFLLKDAMRLNMVSDVEVAVSLSSGTDSTLMFKLAQGYNKKVRAFTFGFEEQEYDEVSRIKQNRDLKTVEIHPVYLDRSEMLPRLREAIYYFEAPLGGVGTLSVYNMMAEVRRQGIKVMLSGEGSDEVFGGYRYYYPAFFKDIEHDSGLLKKELKEYSMLHGQTVKPFSKKYQDMARLIDRNDVLAPDGTGAEIAHVSEFLANSVCRRHPVNTKMLSGRFRQIMYDDLRVKKLPKLLYFQDRSGMSNSVETRVPYLDHRLVNFLYSLPGTFKVRDGHNKFLIKKILKDTYGYVGDNKIKHYVATPQREWLKSEQISNEILETVKGGELVKRKLIDYKRFEKDYLAYIDSAGLGNSFFVWKIINIEYLLNQKWA